MGLIKYLTSRYFLLSLLWMILICVLLFAGIIYGLQSYTKQNQSIEIPDLLGLSLSEVDSKLSQDKLRFKVIDSTYVAGKQAGVVIAQYPQALHKVKEDRRVFLTINAKSAPKVKMPELVDKSIRYAKSQLESIGLKLGKVTRRPDLAKDAVLEQRLDGNKIEAGKLIDKGTAIDLVAGSGYGRTTYKLPKLLGLTYESAINTLESTSLKVGALIADNTVSDTATAIVYKQSPQFYSGAIINTGQSVDVFVTHLDNYGKILDKEKQDALDAQKEKQEQELRRLERINGDSDPSKIKESNPYDPDEWEGTISEPPNRSKGNSTNPYNNKSTIDPDQ